MRALSFSVTQAHRVRMTSDELAAVDVPVRATFLGKISGSIRLTIEGTLHVVAKPPLPPEPEPPPVFEPGVTYPDEDTVGAGILRPYPTTVVHGDAVFDQPPTGPIVDTIFRGSVFVKASGYVFENCAVRGPDERADESCLVYVDPDLDVPPIFRYCDVNPSAPTSYYNGVGYKGFELFACHVWGVVDGMAVIVQSDDPDPAAHVRAVGCWFERSSQFKPDEAGNRDVTHNDTGVQLQGNKGAPDDVLLWGCRVDAYASPEQSSPLPPTHTQISAVMLTPNTQDRVCVTLRQCWLSGGVHTVNASASSNEHSTLVIDECVFEAPHSSTGGPSAAISATSLMTVSSTGNTYEDGSPVPIYVVAA